MTDQIKVTIREGYVLTIDGCPEIETRFVGIDGPSGYEYGRDTPDWKCIFKDYATAVKNIPNSKKYAFSGKPTKAVYYKEEYSVTDIDTQEGRKMIAESAEKKLSPEELNALKRQWEIEWHKS